MYTRVTDPNILKQLNSNDSEYEEVTDPAILHQLNGEPSNNQSMGLGGKLSNAASIFGNDVSKIPGALMEGGINAVNAAPSEIGGAVGQMALDPMRAGGNLASGVGKAEQNIVNSPSALANYLAHLGLIKQKTAGMVPSQKKNYLESFGGTGQPGDTLLQNAPGMSPLVPPVLKGLGLAGKGAMGLGKLIEGTAGVEKAASKIPGVTQGFEESKNALASAKEQSAAETGKTSIPKMQQEIKDTNESLQQSPYNISNAPSHEQALLEHADSANNLHNINQQLTEHLNKGAAHDVRAAAKIAAIQDANRAGISKGYDNLEKDFESKNVEIDNSQPIQEKTKELTNLIKTSQARSPEVNAVLKDLDRLQEEKSVNAKDYLQAYRSTSQYAREARTKAYTPGMNAEERQHWMQTYNDLDDKVEEMGKTLEGSVGGEDYKRLKDLNSRWRNEVVPLQRNTIYQNLSSNRTGRKGQMPSNIMNSLRGSDRGNILMRNIIHNDPELSRNVVGQRFAENPEKLHNADENTQEYLNHMPHLQDLLEQHKQASQNFARTEQGVKDAQQAEATATKHAQARNEIDLLDKHIENLRTALNKKNISLGEKMKAESALEKAKNSRSIRRVVLTAGIGFQGMHKLGSLLSLSNGEP